MKLDRNVWSRSVRALGLAVLLSPFGAGAQIFPTVLSGWDTNAPGDLPSANGYVAGPLVARDGALYGIEQVEINSPSRRWWLDVERWTHCGGWQPLGSVLPYDPYFDPAVTSTAIRGNYLYIAGSFSGISDYNNNIQVGATNVAKLDLTTGQWSPVANWSSAPDWIVSALAVDDNGTVYLGGGIPNNATSHVKLAKVLPDGSVIAMNTLGSSETGDSGGGNPGAVGVVTAMAVDGPNLYVGGRFTTATNAAGIVVSHNFVKWDGSQWIAMGTIGITNLYDYPGSRDLEIHSITVCRSNVFVAGQFDGNACGIAMFNTNGAQLPVARLTRAFDDGMTFPRNGVGDSLAVCNGKVFLGGDFDSFDAMGIRYNGVMEWNGGWQPMGAGVRHGTSSEPYGPGDAGIGRWIAADSLNANNASDVVYVGGVNPGGSDYSFYTDFDFAGDGAVMNGQITRWMETNDLPQGAVSISNPVRSANAFSFNVSAPPGSYWMVYSTFDSPTNPAATWNLVGAVTAWNGSATFTDHTVTPFYDNYYRVGNFCDWSDSIHCTNMLPTVSITKPTNNQVIIPAAGANTANILFTGTVSAPVGFSQVYYYLDGGYWGGGSSPSFSYTFPNIYPGQHTVEALAYDVAGNQGSASVNVIVDNPPTIQITSPRDGASYSGSSVKIIISTTATDTDGTIASVKFYDGATYLGIGNKSGNTYTFGRIFYTGTHVIKAVATDNNGATATSTVTVYVTGGGGGGGVTNGPPVT